MRLGQNGLVGWMHWDMYIKGYWRWDYSQHRSCMYSFTHCIYMASKIRFEREELMIADCHSTLHLHTLYIYTSVLTFSSSQSTFNSELILAVILGSFCNGYLSCISLTWLHYCNYLWIVGALQTV